jgi:uncharacterized protein YukE
VQLAALVDGWRRDAAETYSSASEGSGYHQGYAEALDRCAQALRMVLDTPRRTVQIDHRSGDRFRNDDHLDI